MSEEGSQAPSRAGSSQEGLEAEAPELHGIPSPSGGGDEGRRRPPRIFYGWYIVATGAVVQLLGAALLNQSFGAYVVLLQREMAWSKASIAGAISLMRLESGVLGPIDGWLIDRFGPRAVMRAGMVIFAIGFMLFSQVDSLPAFYATFVILALGANLSGFLPLTVAVVNWFRRRRATALATMQIGFALGGLSVPLVVYFLETFGWRTTAFASGLLILAVGLPLTTFVHHRPEELGLEPDGGTAAAAGTAGAARPHREVSFQPREAVRTPAFWLISLGHGSALLVVSAVMVHLVPHLHEHLGYSLEQAGLVVSLLAAIQIAGQQIGGFLGDRFSKRMIATVCMGAHMAALLLVAYAESFPMVLGFTVLHGLAWGIRGPLMQAIRADYFGPASFGVIMGLSSLIVTFGNTTGPLLAGILADTTGSYESGFTILALLAGVGSVFFLLARRPHPPVREAAPATSA